MFKSLVSTGVETHQHLKSYIDSQRVKDIMLLNADRGWSSILKVCRDKSWTQWGIKHLILKEDDILGCFEDVKNLKPWSDWVVIKVS